MKRKSFTTMFIALAVLILIAVGCESNSETMSDEDQNNANEENTDENSNEGGTAEGDSTSTKTIRYAHFQPGSMDQPKQAAAVAFKSHVEKNTNGALEVEIYPASQLGDAQTVIEGIEMGSIQMGVPHDGPTSTVYPPIGVFNLPYVFNDQGEAWTVYDSDFSQKLFDDMREQTGIRVMALADNGIRHFTNNEREIRSPEDMEDLKIRVQPSPLYETFVEATGASPSSVSWPELPSALQQGVVDGQENGVTNILAASLYENQEYVTLDGHVNGFHAYMINDEFFNGLTDDQQSIVKEGVDMAKWIHRGMTANQDMNAGQILSEQGMTVTELTQEEIEVFRDTTQPPVADWMREEFGAEWVDGLLQEVESLRQ